MNEITEVQGKLAFTAHQSVLNLKRQMGIAFVEMGRLLKEIRDNKHFEALGYDSFQSYIINSELGFKRRTAYYYIEIYEWFVEKFEYELERVAEIGYDKLVRLLPVVKRTYESLPSPKMEQRIELLVGDVQELRPVDFAKKYKDKEKQEEFEDYLAPPEYFRCDCHGKWRLVVPIEDCCPKFLEEFYEQTSRKLHKN